MNKESVTKIIKDVQNGISKHSPEILTGLGIAGMITTTILAVKATPKALENIKADSRKNHDGDPYAYTKKEAIKSSWKCYVPAAITGTVSIGCLIGASSVNARRNAALATAYQISSNALNEYKEKVVETIGETKEKHIQDKLAQDKVDKNPAESNTIIVTGNGKTLCYDPQFNQYFESSIDAIKNAVTEMNHRMVTLGEEYVSLNDFYDELGVDRLDIGDDLGWNVGRDGKLKVTYSSTISKNNQPCVVIHYDIAPKYEYFKFNR